MYTICQICTQMCRDNTKNQNQTCTQSSTQETEILRTERGRYRTMRLWMLSRRGTGDRGIAVVDDANSLHRRAARTLQQLQDLDCWWRSQSIHRLSPQSATTENRGTWRHGLREEKFHGCVVIWGGDLEKVLLILLIIRQSDLPSSNIESIQFISALEFLDDMTPRHWSYMAQHQSRGS